MTSPHPTDRAIHRVVNLIPDANQVILNMTVDEARDRILSGNTESVLDIHGAFALVARDGERNHNDCCTAVKTRKHRRRR